MKITGSIPFHIARAYGAPQKPPVVPSQMPTPSGAPSDVAGITSTAKTELPQAIQELVAGTTNEPMDFSKAASPVDRSSSFQLYTRAADKIEASVAVQVGRSLDVKG